MEKIISVLAVVGLASAGVIPVPVAPLVGHVATQYHAQDELGQYSFGYVAGPSAKEEIKTADGITRGSFTYVLDGNGLVQSAAYASDPVNGFSAAATNLPIGPAVAPDAPAVVSAVPTVAVAPAAEAVAVQAAPLPSTIIQSAVTRFAIQQESPAPVVEQSQEQPQEQPLVEEQTKPEEASPAEAPAAPAVVVPETTIQQLVTPVQDTPEVQAARAAHLAAVEETKLRDAVQEAKDAQENNINTENGEEEKSEEGVEPTEASPEATESPASESETQSPSPAAAAEAGESAPQPQPDSSAQTKILPSVVATELVPAPAPAVAPVASPEVVAKIVPSVLTKEVVAAQPSVAVGPAVVPVAAVPAAVPVAAVRAAVPVAAVPAAAVPSAVIVGAPVAPSPSGPVALEHVGQITSQYHAQDELGQYSYGYSGGPSAKHEVKTADGLTSGGFSYIDSHGLIQSAAYVSDPVNGFRVAATNIPKQREPEYIPDSPEVEEAKQKLFQAQAEHIAKL